MKKSKVIVLLMLVMVCVIGCTKNSTNTESTNDAMQNLSKEVQDASTQESANVTENYADLSTAEKMQNLKVNGHEIGMPCQLGEFKKYFTLKDGYTLEPYPNIVVFPYENNGLEAGEIWVYCSESTENVKDTDWVCIMDIEMFDPIEETGMSFGFCNINEKSTMEEIIKKMGEPTTKTDYISFTYNDNANLETELFDIDQISLSFGEDGSIKECTLFYNINKLEVK
ncbi:MAG: hypothetical protein IJD40_06785 [Lachnospiraceae bacterium]|nr:hypothetical protein [Lachnospiraceae bacterium]